MKQRIEIKAAGLTGYLYTADGEKWNFELGGFYHWFCAKESAIQKAQEQMIRVASQQINREFKKLKRQLS